MRRELLWRFLIYTGFILVAAAFLVFPALKNEEPLRLGLDLKGGIEVILAPDYRLEDRILIGVKNDLVEKDDPDQCSRSPKRILGKTGKQQI